MEEKREFTEELEKDLEKESEKVQEEVNEEILEDNDTSQDDESQDHKEENDDMLFSKRKLKDENKRLQNEVDALKDRLLRLSAEYDNFRKRTAKEKEGIYTEACFDVLKEILPVVDNLERALMAEGNVDDVKKGVEMTYKGVANAFEKLGVEEIDATGEFDPNLHQAVMHVQDENLGTNTIAEVFQKGYKKADKVLRYTVVKVAN